MSTNYKTITLTLGSITPNMYTGWYPNLFHSTEMILRS